MSLEYLNIGDTLKMSSKEIVPFQIKPIKGHLIDATEDTIMVSENETLKGRTFTVKIIKLCEEYEITRLS
tara:strand:+ start:210 stop:419 length:210 start_codon:yes stop_codon:yes gene_type:complete